MTMPKALVGAWLIASAACGCTDSTQRATAPTTGKLLIAVTNPAKHVVTVTVTGPQGFQRTISSTDSMTVPPGQYSVSATADTIAGPIAASLYTPMVSGSPVTVTAGSADTMTVAFGTRPGSGMLWLAGSGQLSGFAPAQLASSGSPIPQIAVTAGLGVENSMGVAFDTLGNLWIVNGDGIIAAFTPTSLSKSGMASAGVTINLNADAFPQSLAFDAHGNLWVGYPDGHGVVEFGATQLHGSGALNATVTILGPAATGIAFDQQGNLWVVSGSLLCYTPSQQATGGAIAAAITVTPRNTQATGAIAFDTAGNLWATGPTSTFELTKAQLAVSDTVSPAVQLTGPASLANSGLAFDESGDLWIAAYSGLLEYTPGQLTSSGATQPAVTIASSTSTFGF